MSSERKDARWQLATKLASEAGLDSINKLPYPITERLLSVSQEVLDQLPPHKITELAKKWNSEDV